MDLSGVFIPTVTPFDASGELDLAGFRGNARAWLDTPISGLVIGGSTGEAVLLDETERLALVEAAAEVSAQASGDRLVIAGTGAESRRTTLRMTREAADAGADAVLVQPPSFYRGAMRPEVIAEHYEAVADASPVPVIVYQVPLHLNTIEIPDEITMELSEHANIVGIKDSRGKVELVEKLVQGSTADFQVLVGNGALLHPALQVGAAGGILGVANILPAACARIHRAFEDGDEETAARVQALVAPVHRAVVGGMGVPGVKRCLDLQGLSGGEPRPPLRRLPESRVEELEALLAAAAG
jgi:4-hydroxy-2-oxoglutarate aldolase